MVRYAIANAPYLAVALEFTESVSKVSDVRAKLKSIYPKIKI